MKQLFFRNIFGKSFGFIFSPMRGAEKNKQLAYTDDRYGPVNRGKNTHD
jgi:hypothetical protein